MKGFKKLFIANLREYIRDSGTLFVTMLFPVILIFIFSIVFGGSDEASSVLNIGIIASDNDMHQIILDNLSDTGGVVVYSDNEVEELKALKNGDRDVVLKLPNVSYHELTEENSYEIQVLYDMDSDLNVLAYIRQLFVVIEDQLMGSDRKINITQTSVNETEKISTFNYMLPGVLALALMQLGLFASLEFLNLKEKNVLRGLSITPLSRISLLSSELALRLLVALVQLALVSIIASFVFGVTIAGNVFYLILIVMLGVLTFSSLGYFLITIVKTAAAGNIVIQIATLLMVFLSGIFIPVEIMPGYLKPIVTIMPLSYLGDALRQVILGIGEYSMYSNILVLLAFLISTSALTIKLWTWE